MNGEVQSHYSTLKASGECRAKGDNRELEHGDEVFVAMKVKVNSLTFPPEKDGMITRQHAAKVSDDEMYIITPDEFDRATAKYKEDETNQLSIIGEQERNGAFDGTEGTES